jgi:peptidoglycan/LPS O-acetylase OafA/YrhL
LLYVAYWLAVLGISYAIWRGIEKPSQRWIRSRFGAKRDAIPNTLSVSRVIDS